MAYNIRKTSPYVPEVEAVIRAHNAFCNTTGPAGSCHSLNLSELDVPSVTLWSCWQNGTVLGIGALNLLGDGTGEVKSMHTLARARGTGVGQAILDTIVAAARSDNLRSLWLETGTAPEFGAARAIYERSGFTPCPPFGSYKLDPHSAYYTLALAGD